MAEGGTFHLSCQAVERKGSSSKSSVAKPNETKMFRSVFPYSLKKCCFFCPNNSIILWCRLNKLSMAIEELFNGQLSFADIDAEKFLHVRRAHADRRVNAMDRLTDDVIHELIQLCLPHYHIKAGVTVQQGRPYTRLETMVRVHLLQVSLNLSDPEMESYLASDMVARSFCRVSSTRLFISDSTILRFRHFIEQHGLAQKFLERTVNLAVEAGACSFEMVAADGTFIFYRSAVVNQEQGSRPRS